MAPCFSPISAWQGYDGTMYFDDPGNRRDIQRKLQLRCRRCIGCRTERAEIWAARCMHEASLYSTRTRSNNEFITLTFRPEEYSFRGGSLDYTPFQLFMKRLRKESAQPVRFYMSGEYSPIALAAREAWPHPHFHAILFNGSFGDRTRFQKNKWGDWTYRSRQLERLWPFGYSTTGDVDHASARYVAGYVADKLDGPKALDVYARTDQEGRYELPPPFSHMSTRPGIGAGWLAKYRDDVYKASLETGQVWQDGLVMPKGRKLGAPVYYDRLLERSDPELLEAIKEDRERRGLDAQAKGDGTPERLAVREEIMEARLAWRKRS